MKKLPKPTELYESVFDDCISNIQNNNLKLRYSQSKQFILDAGIDFEQKMQNQQLYKYPPSNTINNSVITSEEMNNLYTNKLAKSGQPGRIYYDKLKLAPAQGRCPLCGVRSVNTLDHYLPKTKFPIFSIFPYNLIPACRDCNTEKKSIVAEKHAEETIHPYYDDIENIQWLSAHIERTNPVTFIYTVSNNVLDQVLTSRLKKHMEVFHLYELYTSHAGEELSNIIYQLQGVFNHGGANAVKAHLKEHFESRFMNNKNSWQTAMYKAMYEDGWFHSHGFELP